MSSSTSRVLRNVALDMGDGPASQTPRVLRSPAVELPGDRDPAGNGRVLRQPSVGEVDMDTPASHVGQADLEEQAYQRGLQDGREAARQQLQSASSALQTAIDQGRAQLRAEFERQQEEIVRLAVDMAGEILGHANHDGGEALRQRLRQALARLDDTEMVIAMNQADLPLADEIDAAGVVFVPDPDLEPGEARISGQWAQADLTYAVARQLLREQVVT